MDSQSSDSEGYEDVDDLSTDIIKAVCLFCDTRSPTAEASFVHMKKNHAFDIVDFYEASLHDFYSYIKFVNYMRKTGIARSQLDELQRAAYEDESFLFPVLNEDALLQVDIDDLVLEWPQLTGWNRGENTSKNVPSERVTAVKLQAAEKRALEAEESLQRAIEDLNRCKAEVGHHLLDTQAKTEADDPKPDRYYFESYSYFGIHEEMLKDRVRTDGYRTFILQNEEVFRDKVVLDIGCGTGILSMFAAKAGAKLVVGVDQSEIAYTAMDVVRENGLEGKIHIYKDKAENLAKRTEGLKFDVIVSEWMGYFLLFENMLSTVLFCRDHLLQPSGLVYPNKFSLHLVGVMDQCLRKEHVEFWDDVYGFQMSAVKNKVDEEAIVELVKPDTVMTTASEIAVINMMDTTSAAQEFEADFFLTAEQDGDCTALVGYFDTYFDRSCVHSVYFSTGPNSEATHWKQTVFLLDKSIRLSCGDTLQGKIVCKKLEKDHRSLQIDITIGNQGDSHYSRKKFYMC